MLKDKLIFNGNEKQIFATDDPGEVLIRFKDVTLAYYGVKRARFVGKGAIDNKISAYLLKYLNENGVDTHFVNLVSDDEQLCRKVDSIPIELSVRNEISGSLAPRLGLEDCTRIPNTIVDFRYNNDRLDDPVINEHHAVALGLVSYEEMDFLIAQAMKVNDILKELFLKIGIELIDIKLEFGRAVSDGKIIISDEISPDTMRLRDIETGNRLDKDRFRLDMSDVVVSYQLVLERLAAFLGEN